MMKLYKTALEFFDNYRTLILDPAENAGEIIVATALIFISLITFFLLAFILFSSIRSFVARNWARPRRVLRLPIYAGIAVAVLALGFAIVLPVTSNSIFCGRTCHSMNPAFQSWRRSMHSNVPCSACHLDSSLVGLIKNKVIVGPANVQREITGRYRVPINARSDHARKRLPNDRCLACHKPKKLVQAVKLGLSVSHESHADADVRCTACHNRIAHQDPENYSPLKQETKKIKYLDFMDERGCRRCHRRNPRQR